MNNRKWFHKDTRSHFLWINQYLLHDSKCKYFLYTLRIIKSYSFTWWWKWYRFNPYFHRLSFKTKESIYLTNHNSFNNCIYYLKSIYKDYDLDSVRFFNLLWSIMIIRHPTSCVSHIFSVELNKSFYDHSKDDDYFTLNRDYEYVN